MIATLTESANFWASVATLWGVAAAWGTYYGAVLRHSEERDRGLRGLLRGLEAELTVVSDWAGGSEDNPGYLQRPVDELRKKHFAWCYPSRVIFSFECPTIRNLTNSAYIRELGPIVDDVVELSRSITRLFDYYEEYRQYVISRTSLYDSAVEKLMSAKPAQEGEIELDDVVGEDESRYLARVFEFNRKIHQEFIGGADSADAGCLHRTFRKARKSVDRFSGNYTKPSSPWWYWILHVVAAAAFIKGLLLSLAWLRVC